MREVRVSGSFKAQLESLRTKLPPPIWSEGKQVPVDSQHSSHQVKPFFFPKARLTTLVFPLNTRGREQGLRALLLLSRALLSPSPAPRSWVTAREGRRWFNRVKVTSRRPLEGRCSWRRPGNPDQAWVKVASRRDSCLGSLHGRRQEPSDVSVT